MGFREPRLAEATGFRELLLAATGFPVCSLLGYQLGYKGTTKPPPCLARASTDIRFCLPHPTYLTTTSTSSSSSLSGSSFASEIA